VCPRPGGAPIPGPRAVVAAVCRRAVACAMVSRVSAMIPSPTQGCIRRVCGTHSGAARGGVSAH
jgi:hypothetical protein